MRLTALVFAGYLAIGSLFPGADFSQLPRMGEAYWHFQEHQEETRRSGGVISYLEFVKIHFLQPGRHKSSHNHHNRCILQQAQTYYSISIPLPWADT